MANGFGSLYVGASGLQNSQNGLNVIANNMANVNTTGYVRQQVVQIKTIHPRGSMHRLANRRQDLVLQSVMLRIPGMFF